MENLITQENLDDIRGIIESKIAHVPGNYILLGAIGSLLISSYLNKIGKKDAASLIGSLSIPIIGIGIAKYKDLIKSEVENQLQAATNNS